MNTNNLLLIVICFAALFCVMLYHKIISKKRKKEIDQLKYQRFHDPITGHTNWEWMWNQIDFKTTEQSIPYSFVHFDIKAYKLFNELYSHDVGNEVLKFVSKTLYAQDFIKYSCRCHNDNFAFVVDPDFNGDLREVLNKMFESMKCMPGLEEYPIYYRAGVVERGMELRKNDSVADMAKMAQALGRKMNCTEIIFYDSKMKDVILRGEQLKLELPEAMLRDEILVYLQPKINANTEKIYGAEALVRWLYHGKKLMFPNEFIEPLERNNAIGMLDEHVLEVVCRYFEKWKSEGKELYPISINLSQKELSKESLVDDIIAIVNRHDVDRKLIEFELTESSLHEDRDYMLSIMKRLRDAGFSLSMDDFGTGYSSFGILKDMPLDTLKIDKSFVDSVCMEKENNKGERIVEDLVGMVKHLDLKCVAEGVEHANQKDMLKDWGCDYIQGYYYSKPIPVNDFEAKYLSL